MIPSDQFKEHIAFFEELGITAVSRDRSWKTRAVDVESRGASAFQRDPRQTQDASGKAGVGPTERQAKAFASKSSQRVDAIKKIAQLRAQLGECTRCKLHSTRTNLVYGAGNPSADLMFVGEAPGRDEDRQGVPFVGRAGQLLTKIIEAIDLTRDDVYIANVIKCRPPKNRNPEPDEIKTCDPFLLAQIDAIQPKVIVALGAFAVRTLLESSEPISKLRGRVFAYRGAKLVPTFHPAYLLRSPEKKRDVWKDIKKVQTLLREE